MWEVRSDASMERLAKVLEVARRPIQISRHEIRRYDIAHMHGEWSLVIDKPWGKNPSAYSAGLYQREDGSLVLGGIPGGAGYLRKSIAEQDEPVDVLRPVSRLDMVAARIGSHGLRDASSKQSGPRGPVPPYWYAYPPRNVRGDAEMLHLGRMLEVKREPMEVLRHQVRRYDIAHMHGKWSLVIDSPGSYGGSSPQAYTASLRTNDDGSFELGSIAGSEGFIRKGISEAEQPISVLRATRADLSLLAK